MIKHSVDIVVTCQKANPVRVGAGKVAGLTADGEVKPGAFGKASGCGTWASGSGGARAGGNARAGSGA